MTWMATGDAAALQELVIDVEKGLRFIREAQGYGRVTVTIEVRKGGIAMWEVSQAVTRKASGESPRTVIDKQGRGA